MRMTPFLLIFSLCFLFFISLSIVQAENILTVDNEGDGDFRSLQNAIDQSTNDTLIYVYSGFYTERVIIDKPITIIGKNEELGSGIDTGIPVISGQQNNTVITINSDHVIFENLNITRGEATYLGGGINLNANNCIIKNNIIYDNKYGIIINGDSNTNLFQNTIESNQFINNEHGLHLFYSKKNDITNNIFKNCSLNINGDHPSHFYHKIQHNQINDLPLYYATNSTSLTLNGIIQSYGEIILINCSNVHISEMNITKTSTAIELAFCNQITIENNTVSHSQTGLYDYQSSYNKLNNNRFSNNTETGIVLHQTNNHQIKTNIFQHNFDGIRNEFSTENNIIENDILNNNNNGIYLRNTSKTTLSKNLIRSNSGGIYAYTTTDESIYHNTISSNTGNGLLINNGLNNSISSNNINNNSLNGIQLKKETKESTITNNSIGRNAHYGIYITDASNHNQIYHNFFRLNGHQIETGANAYDECINNWDQDYPTHWQNWEYRFSEEYGGNYWQDHNKIDNHNGPSQNNQGSDNIIDQSYKITGGNNIDHYPILPIGKTIYVDKNGQADYTSIQKAIDIAKSKTTILIHNGVYNEHLTINNPINLIGGKETIIDGKEQGNIIEINCNEVTLSHITIQGSGPNQAGIIINSDNNIIEHNLITQNNEGIKCNSASSNLISNNSILLNNGIGITLQQNSQYNTLINNTISQNYKGIKCISGSKQNTIQNNTISSHILDGIELVSTSQHRILQNQFKKNNPGLLLSDVTSSTISENNFKHCGIIFLQVTTTQPPNNTIINNTVNEKPLHYYENKHNLSIPAAGQIILVNCSHCHITNQQIHNTTIGIELWNSDHCVLTDNILTGNEKGLYLVNSNHNSIHSNSINDSNTAILCYDASDNQFTRNTIEHNEDGIRFTTCSNNQITQSTIHDNTDNGIELYSSSLNRIQNNTISNNDHGIFLETSTENQIRANIIIDNDEGTLIKTSNKNIFLNNSFADDGLIIQSSTQNQIQNNTVNNKPLIYYENKTDASINQAGQIILINCSQMNIESQQITDTPIAIQLLKCSECNIFNNSVSNAKKGILIDQSIKNTITQNTFTILDTALDIYDSNYNNIINNICSKNTFGIILSQSDQNNLSENTITSSVFSAISINVGFHNQISDCILQHNDNGISLDHAIHTIINNNAIQQNFRGIQLTSSTQNKIEFCHIHDNYWGIKLGLSQHNNINHCIISDNAGGITRGKNNVIQQNNFIKNGLHCFGEPDKKNQYNQNYWDTHQNRFPYHIYGKNIDWRPKNNPYDLQTKTDLNITQFEEKYTLEHYIREKINNFVYPIIEKKIIPFFTNLFDIQKYHFNFYN